MKKSRGQAVTDKILDTASHLFYFQGYNSTGINQVIEEADIAKASLYKHFDSKTDLMVAYLERTHQRWYDGLVAEIEKIADPKSKLLAIVDYHIGRQNVREFGGCPFIKANNEAGLQDERILSEIQKAKNRLKELISGLVAASTHKKLLSDEELAEAIFLITEGAIVAASVFKNQNEMLAAKELIKKLI